MTWFKVDDKFWSHRKTRKLSAEAVALWVRAGSYCGDHLTDGVIESHDIEFLGGSKSAAEELVSAGLWLSHVRGYCFHDWEHYQPTKAKRDQERAAWRERQARSRKIDTTSLPVPSRPESRRESRRDTTVTPPPVSEVLADLARKVAND